MRFLFLKFFSLFFVLTTSSLFTQENLKSTVNFQFDNIKRDTINRNLFGGFTEFLNDYINGSLGLWAQELQDRGFDYTLGSDSKTSLNWEHWSDNNVLDSIYLEKEDKYNKNGLYSQYIENKDGIGATGVRQRILISDTITHSFYIYAKSSGIKLNVSILDNEGNIVYKKDIESTNEWEKYEFQMPKLNVNNAYIYLTINEMGYILLDESSLMPDNNEFGIRSEYAELFKKWKPSVLRYPGGSFISNPGGVWWKSINHIDQRSSPNIYGLLKINQRMDFGIIEYLTFCEKFNYDPYVVSAYLRHDLDDHLNYLEYMMGEKNTEFGSLRASHGREKPFEIKYYEIGNEEWAEPIKYAEDFKYIYSSIKKKYPKLKIIAAGNNWGGQDYIEDQMEIIDNDIDIYGWHPAKTDLVNNDLHDSINFLSIVGIPDYYGNGDIINNYNYCRKFNSRDEFKVGITEWWSHYGDLSDWILDSNWRNNSLESGLWDTGMLLGFMKNPKYIELANRTVGMSWINRKVNKITGKKAIFPSVGLKSAIFLNSHRGNIPIPTEINSPTFVIHKDSIFYHFHTIYLYFINRSPNQPMEIETNLGLLFKGEIDAKKYVLTSNYFLDYISAEDQNKIKFTQHNIKLNSKIVVNPFSFVTYAFANNSLTNIENNSSKNIASSELIEDYLYFDKYSNFNSLKIYDISGKSVFNMENINGSETIDLSELDRGFYMCVIFKNDTQRTIRIYKK